jgi:hypothetical protein
MAARKQGFRRIVVDGVAYRWKFPHRLTENQQDGWPGVRVLIQRVEPGGAFLYLEFPQRHHMSGPCSEFGKPVLPAEVASGIRAALAAGWQADRPSRPFQWPGRGDNPVTRQAKQTSVPSSPQMWELTGAFERSWLLQRISLSDYLWEHAPHRAAQRTDFKLREQLRAQIEEEKRQITSVWQEADDLWIWYDRYDPVRYRGRMGIAILGQGAVVRAWVTQGVG